MKAKMKEINSLVCSLLTKRSRSSRKHVIKGRTINGSKPNPMTKPDQGYSHNQPYTVSRTYQQ